MMIEPIIELAFEDSDVYYDILLFLKNRGYTFGSKKPIKPKLLRPPTTTTKETIVLYYDKTIRLSRADYNGQFYTMPQILVKRNKFEIGEFLK